METLLTIGPLGHHFAARTYTILTLGFTTVDEAAQERAIENLKLAADKITEEIPYLRGQVVTEGFTDTDSGTHRVVPCPQYDRPGKFVEVKDFRKEKDVPTYGEILSKNGPLSLIKGELFSPGLGFPHVYPQHLPTPVVLMQANLLQGGMLLTICGQHNVMDGNANARFMHMFAKLCSGGELSSSERAGALADRTQAIPEPHANQSLDPVSFYRAPSTLKDSPPPWPPVYGKSRWRTYHISAENIAKLQAMARDKSSASPDSNVEYVSTNDILTGLIWRNIIRVRNIDQAGAQTNLIRAVNGRTRFEPPLSPDYLDHVIYCPYTKLAVTDLLSLPLYRIAEKLRQTLADEVTPHMLQSFVHLLKTTKDRSTISYGASMTANDMLITSFVSQGIYDVNFGEDSGLGDPAAGTAGLPDLVRRPDLPGGEGIVWILPKGRDGSIDLAMHLFDKDAVALATGQGSDEWNGLVEYIG